MLVFLHEGLGSADLWRDFPERVASSTGCPVLAYSRSGYGRSSSIVLPRPLTYMHDEGIGVLPELLEALSITDAILVGHSDGASIAIVFAGSGDPRASRVRGIVLEAPHVFVEDVSITSIEAAKVAYEKGDLKKRLEKWHGENVEVAFRGWNAAWLDPGFRSWNIERYLAGISVPVMAIQGAGDEYGTLAQLDAIESGLHSPFERVVLPGCGHAPHRDQPEATLAAITRFVRALIQAS